MYIGEGLPLKNWDMTPWGHVGPDFDQRCKLVVYAYGNRIKHIKLYEILFKFQLIWYNLECLASNNYLRKRV